MAVALRLENLGLLIAFRHQDSGLFLAAGLGDHGAPVALGGHLPVHRVLHVARRQDFANLHRRNFHAPTRGNFIELRAQDVVYLFAFRQDVVERNIANHGAKRGRGNALGSARKVGHLHDAIGGFRYLPIDEKVDEDRGIIRGDATLLRNFKELLAQVDAHRPIDNRPEPHDSRSARISHDPPEPEDDQSLIFRHNLDGRVCKPKNQNCQDYYNNDQLAVHST